MGMNRGLIALAAVLAALLVVDSALGDGSPSVTATSTGVVTVRPRDRHSEKSIEAAVEAAQDAAIPIAVRNARSRALAYAHAAGLTLGPVISVSDAGGGFYAGGPWGPFGPTQFCGRGVQPPQPPFIGFGVASKRTHVKHCFVPPFETATLTIVYAVGSSGPAGPKTVAAAGIGVVKVRPRDRHSEASIEAAVAAAQKAGIPLAISNAGEYAGKYASAAGLVLGSVSSVSDGGGGYGFGFVGPFGPNRYCGKIASPIVRIRHGHRRVVGFKRVHRCFVPPVEVTSLSVTYTAT
jgi:hypothetical protein